MKFPHMVFDIKSTKNKKIEKFYKKAIKELNEFYKINWNRNQPRVLLIHSRKDMDDFYNRKTENWSVGSAIGSNMILLLHPDVYEKESIHKYSDEGYENLLKHEISHLYTNIFYKEYYPVWLMEGIAVYSSGQLKRKPKVEKFEKFLHFFKDRGGEVYNESGWAVMILDKEFGRDKLLELLKSLNGTETEEDVNMVFKKIFGIELGYKWFNDRIGKYI